MQQETKNAIHLNKKNEEKLFGKPEKYDYSKYSQDENFGLDEELVEKFAQIAQKLDLSQSSADSLLELALEMSKKQDSARKNDETSKKEATLMNYQKMFEEDMELPNSNSSQIKEYMRIADSAYNEFASPKLKEIFKEEGLIYHPELIKMFYKLGEEMECDNLNFGGKPAQVELTPAQILYGPRE